MKIPRVSSLLLALGTVVLLSAPALAAQPAATTVAPAAKPAPAAAAPVTPVGVVSSDAVKSMETMTTAQRDAKIKAIAEKLKKMTPKERQAFFEKNRENYAKMPPEQRKAFNDKIKRQSLEYIAAHKKDWNRSLAEQEKLQDKYSKEFLEKMPGVERAVLLKYKELRKTHSKDYAWRMIIEDAGKGNKITPVTE